MLRCVCCGQRGGCVRGGEHGKVTLGELEKDLECTIPHPKLLRLDPGDAGEPGIDLSR